MFYGPLCAIGRPFGWSFSFSSPLDENPGGQPNERQPRDTDTTEEIPRREEDHRQDSANPANPAANLECLIADAASRAVEAAVEGAANRTREEMFA